MLKKCILTLGLALGGSVAGLLFGHSQAFACTNGVCGYFANGNDSAQCNVLPDPSIKSFYGTGNCWLNSSGGNGHSKLYGDTDTTTLISDMQGYLYETSGNAGYNLNAQTGAAFIIDYMLGRDFHNGSPSAGIADARANFAVWSNEVNALGVNSCYISTQLTCPGKTFGINWGYQPPYFCSSPTVTSAYDPWVHDTPLYGTISTTCDHDWRASIPEIVFYWNNGANSFHIGSQCGNVQSRADKLPVPNRVPTGSITVTCTNAAVGQQVATVSFGDLDGATTAYIVMGGWNSSASPVNSPGPDAINLPLPPTTNPYGGQTVTLWVRDVGPLGSGAYSPIASASTASCVAYGCGTASTNPALVDPYMMNIALTVSATASPSVPPPSPTFTATITPPVGASYSWSGGPQAASTSGATSTTVFGGIAPGGFAKTGLYGISWTFYVSGSPVVTCGGSLTVVYLPYLNVYGGDVMVGASPSYNSVSGASSCLSDSKGGIFSWNNHNAGYSGAGTQYAAQALDQILDFSTSLSSTNTPPVGLSFANTYSPADPTQLDPTQGLFGGNFGGITADCDFTSDLSGVTKTNADLTIAGHTVALSTREVYYVTGHDVYITAGATGGVVYAGTGGWANISQIPYFKVVVAGGDIYIDSGVTKLDGIYIAESNTTGTGGRIFTCASAIRVPWNPAAAGYFAACHNKLTITGAFVAKQARFLRTFGSVGQAKTTDTLTTNNDAEVFNYTPEIWLPRGASIPGEGYTAITGLPPVL